MKARRSWEEINVPPRPLCFDRWPALDTRPSSFQFDTLPAPEAQGTVRLYYRNGWTAVIFWNRRVYFADEILTFDAIIELIRGRFGFTAPANRDFL